MEKDILYKVVRNCLLVELAKAGNRNVPVAISNRHIHISYADIEKLFGAGHQLHPIRAISQPDQYACEEKLDLIGAKGTILAVRVLGPVRRQTQIEISITDSYKLGIEPVVRMSGDLDGTPGIRLRGPAGVVDLPNGVIISARHLHMSESEALVYCLRDGDKVRIQKNGIRQVIYENVIVRSGKGHSLEVHLDTDEANATGINCGDILKII